MSGLAHQWALTTPGGHQVAGSKHDILAYLRSEMDPLNIPYEQGDDRGTFSLYGLATYLMRDEHARQVIVDGVGADLGKRVNRGKRAS